MFRESGIQRGALTALRSMVTFAFPFELCTLRLVSLSLDSLIIRLGKLFYEEGVCRCYFPALCYPVSPQKSGVTPSQMPPYNLSFLYILFFLISSCATALPPQWLVNGVLRISTSHQSKVFLSNLKVSYTFVYFSWHHCCSWVVDHIAIVMLEKLILILTLVTSPTNLCCVGNVTVQIILE